VLRAEKKHPAIACDSGCGPDLYDITVSDHCSENTKSRTFLGLAYTNDTRVDSRRSFTGSLNFQVTEIEVFEITAETAFHSNLFLLVSWWISRDKTIKANLQYISTIYLVVTTHEIRSNPPVPKRAEMRISRLLSILRAGPPRKLSLPRCSKLSFHSQSVRAENSRQTSD
jgi:hypothetical protein